MKRMGYLFLFLAAATGWGEPPTIWTPELQMQVKTIGSVVPSPDGTRVAYQQTRGVMEAEKSEMDTQIFLARADGSQRVQLTRGTKSASSPAFSPDGRFVYFQSERSGKPNLWRIPVDGGEAEMLTDWKGAIGGFEVSPDGKWIAFTGREEDTEKEKAKKEKRDYTVVDDDPANHSLWVFAAEASGKREPRKLFDATYHITGMDWSPDSRRIAFSHQPMPKADYWTKSELAEVEVEGGKVTELATEGLAERDPLYSPDGRYLAYVASSTDPPRWADQERMGILTRADGTSRLLRATYDERPALLEWAADSQRLFFMEPKHTQVAVYAMPLDGPPTVIHSPETGVIGFGTSVNQSGTHVGFAYEKADSPPEAYVMALPAGQPVQLSQANTDLPGLPIGKTEVIRWKAKDGLEIEGLLTYPASYEAGKKYPLILNIHGGPAGVFAQSFIGRPGIYPLAAFTAKGYAVLRCNIRGSGGYGKDFRFANLNDWGGKDYQDLMAGVDHVISMGVADPERLAVMGWSYGGYMTSWVIGQTSRFKAAAVGAGVTNLWSFTGTADIPGFLPDYFSGEPWENFEAYRKHSPMSYVQNVTTPTLILHGESDDRVPISQGYELHNALHRRGLTSKMVVYPRMPHGPREPKFMLDIMQRHLDWVEKYVP